MNNIIRLPVCGGCNKVIHSNKEEVVCELNGRFHIQCWNEIVEDLNKVADELDKEEHYSYCPKMNRD